MKHKIYVEEPDALEWSLDIDPVNGNLVLHVNNNLSTQRVLEINNEGVLVLAKGISPQFGLPINADGIIKYHKKGEE